MLGWIRSSVPIWQSLIIAGVVAEQPATRNPSPRECVHVPVGADSLLTRGDVKQKLNRKRYPDAYSSALDILVGREPLQVRAISWNAPGDGVLLIFSCSGRLKSTTSTGPVDSLWVVSFNGSVPPIVAVLSAHQTALSYRDSSITLYRVNAREPVQVWSAVFYEESAARDGDPLTVSRRLRFDGRRGIIRVTEVGSDGQGVGGDEVFSWDKRLQRFVRTTE